VHKATPALRRLLPPVQLSGLKKSLDIHLDFQADTIDEILQRLSELRTQMDSSPARQ
jgi:hypothetical protein